MNKIIFLFAVLVASSSNAQEIAAKYNVYWNNVHAADLVIAYTNTDINVAIKTSGLIERFFKWSNVSNTKYDKHTFQAAIFVSETHDKKKDKSTTIVYKDGNIVSEKIIPQSSFGDRQLVSSDLKKSSVDPLLALLIAQKDIKYAVENNLDHITINVYNGKYIATIQVSNISKQTVKINNKNQLVIKTIVKYYPIAGYTDKELKHINSYLTDINLYLDVNTYLPISLDAANWSDKANIKLEKSCNTYSECL